MLKAIIEKEIRDVIGSSKFAVTFGVCAVLIIAVFWVGAARHKVNQEQYEASLAENLRQLEGVTDWFNIGDIRVFMPPQPLASLVSGVSNDIGRTSVVRGRGELTAQDSRYNEDPIFAAFRFLDLDFMFKIILSLFAILLGYNAISGEKERGTLRLAFANSVPRHTFILGKLIGSSVALTVSILIAVGLGCLILPLMGISLVADEWIRLALIILTGLMYFGVFLTMSVCVSAMTQRSSSSFLILLVIWIMSVQIIPRVSVLMAGRAVDVPSVDEISAQKTSFATNLHNEMSDAMGGFSPSGSGADVMDEFQNFMDSIHNYQNEQKQALANRLNEDRHNRQVQQQKVAFGLSRVSPSASLSLAMASLAGTSLELKQHFKDEATEYQNTYGEFLQEKTGAAPSGMRMVRITVGDEESEKPKPIDPSELPVFDFKPIDMAKSVGGAIVDLGVLMMFNLLFFAGAFVAFVRYDLR